MKTVRLTTAAGHRPLPDRPANRDRRREAPLVPGRVRHLRPRQRHVPRSGARRGAATTLPTWRGQNEQGMALAAVALRQGDAPPPDHGGDDVDRPRRDEHGHRRRGGDGQPSAGAAAVRRHVPEPHPRPGAAAGRALRRPLDHGQRRVPRRHALLGPHRHGPSRCSQSLPQALATMLDPADCGPAFLALPQDVQAEAFDSPSRFFEPDAARRSARPRPDRAQLAARGGRAPRRRAAADRRRRRRALLARRGRAARRFAERHGIPVVETVAGKSTSAADHPCYAGPDRRDRLRRRPTGSPPRPTSCSPSAPACRTSPPARGRCSRNDAVRIIGLNAARFDAGKHLAAAARGRRPRGARRARRRWLGDWRAPDDVDWHGARRERSHASSTRSSAGGPRPATAERRPTRRSSAPSTGSPTADDYALDRGRRLPRRAQHRVAVARGRRRFDCEYGYSCMGYEISGAWGAKMAHAPTATVFVLRRRRLVPDDEQRPVQLGAVRPQADRDRVRQRRLRGHRPAAGQPGRRVVQQPVRRRAGRGAWVAVDFAAHAASMGCDARRRSTTIAELEAAFARARAADRTAVIVIETDPARLDRGRRVLGGRRAGGERSAGDPSGAGSRRRGQGATSGTGGERDGDRCGWRSSGAGGSGACTPSCSPARIPGASLATVYDVVPELRAVGPRRRLGVPAARRRSTSCTRRRRRRGGDLHQHRHPRRPDRRAPRPPGEGDLLREADLARPRRGRRRARRGRARRAPCCRSASTAASTRPPRRARRGGQRRARRRRTSCGSPAATRPRRRSRTLRRSGGLFLDMTIHDFDMARFVARQRGGRGVRARCRARSTPAIGAAGDVDTAVVHARARERRA